MTGLVLSTVLSVALALSSYVAVRHRRAIDDLRERITALEAAGCRHGAAATSADGYRTWAGEAAERVRRGGDAR